ncbi:MAG: ATP-binding protein [Lacunisphaera sp.]
MSTPLPTPVVPEHAVPIDQRGAILLKASEDSPSFIAIFQKPTLSAIFLNTTAKLWLDPEGHSALTDLTLTDITGVSGIDLFEKEILVHIGVFGKWQGDWILRDVWGSELSVRATLTNHPGKDGRSAGFVCLHAIRNVAPENTVTSDSFLLHALLETTPLAIYFKDLQSRFIRVSRSLARKDGTGDPANLIGLTDFDRFTAEHAQPAYDAEQRIIRTGEPIIDLEEKETWADGRIAWVSTTKQPLRNAAGKIIGTFGTSRDITAGKLAEQEHHDLEIKYQLAQKLESIGRLAAGVAHEINTPTQFITDNTTFLTNSFNQISTLLSALRSIRDAASRHPDLVEQVRLASAIEQEIDVDYLLREIPTTLAQTLDGLGRVARIVRSLKEFSHPNNTERSPVDLNRIIETAVTISRHEWKYVADLVTDFDPELPLVRCMLDEFNQVMLNLIINAVHAIESVVNKNPSDRSRGTITIRTRHNYSHVLVEVEDTGGGIPEEIRGRIFDPFFTTKELGKGTGQGLAIVHAVVVKNHGGKVDFTSEVGRGTTFCLQLPL